MRAMKAGDYSEAKQSSRWLRAQGQAQQSKRQSNSSLGTSMAPANNFMAQRQRMYKY
jgi:hypothetical protein